MRSEEAASSEWAASPVFPWNDAIDMSADGGDRAVVLCLSAVFDAVEALRLDLHAATERLAQNGS